MKKILIVLIFSAMTLFAEVMGKSGGCTLTQSGNFTVQYDNRVLKDVHYIMPAKSGGNFRELFVGGELHGVIPKKGNKFVLKLLDYKPNVRIKGKPKTGIFIVAVQHGGKTERIDMPYIFDAGLMKIYTKQQADIDIVLTTKVAYSLCHVK